MSELMFGEHEQELQCQSVGDGRDVRHCILLSEGLFTKHRDIARRFSNMSRLHFSVRVFVEVSSGYYSPFLDNKGKEIVELD